MAGKKMRIVSLTSLFPNRMNPVRGVFIKERLRHVARRHDLRVVAPVPYFPPIRCYHRWDQYTRVPSRERIGPLPVYHPRYVTIPRVGMALYGLLYFLSLYPFLRRLHRRRPFDLLDAHYLYPDGLAAVLLARALGLPVVLSARGTDVNLFMRLPLIRSWILYALRRCDRIVAVSGALKEVMVTAGIGPRKIDVVPNGVDASLFPTISREQARAELGLNPIGRIILSVGSLRPSKNFEHLLRALKKIRSDPASRDISLAIVGYGHHRSQLEREISRLGLQDHVVLAGRVPHEQMVRWYRAADLFCLASGSEGWPNVIFEALACGLPVVSTPVGGVPEILISSDYGILLEDAEPSRLTAGLHDALRQALEKDWDRDRLAAYARQHTWDRVADQVIDCFRRTLNGRRSMAGRELDDGSEERP